ncbi:ABC transporter ATP-binding protein [Acrocarpospora phusangensis]|uniref:ABC-type quaternary amine transporter n=1 Tax=Acrocarpospora phusangensis TaxID=1070424 RepID=A0A919Q7Z7_9ACTN|nr:ABC transporter ATP-binding protein [Acrocarpospora phusangensis]GIH24134.1 ABC transporter ATP-binding protein [Acrocarpospora phusangensis]
MTTPPSDSGRIELTDLCKRYGSGPLVVDNVTIDIASGEFVTLLGPSGSGKTTTLNMIAGFTEVTSGRIRLGGRDIAPLPPHKRDFGMVFQNYALFPHMTVAQNVAFPLRERKVPKAEIARLVARTLELVDLADKGGRRPDELSGGQQQRVALARAVVFSPSVLLLDEPLSALDRKLRQSLQQEIKRLHAELKLTFVFVTHDQDEAMSLSDRIAVFNEGRVERVGTPADLYRDPGTRFVARFLGESNLFAGQVRPGGVYEWGGHKWALPAADGSPERDLVVRPERLRVAASSADVPGEANQVPATVTGLSFQGTHQRIELDYGDGVTGTAVLSPDAPGADLRPGTGVTAYWDPAHQVLVTRN